MSRSARLRHALPLSVLILFTVLDLAAGREQQSLALTVISPLVAATVVGRRATAAYAVLAVVVAACALSRASRSSPRRRSMQVATARAPPRATPNSRTSWVGIASGVYCWS